MTDFRTKGKGKSRKVYPVKTKKGQNRYQEQYKKGDRVEVREYPINKTKTQKRLVTTDEYYGTIADLNDREDLILLTDELDVREIKNNFGNGPAVQYDGFFVKVGDGDYDEVYGFDGIVPRLDKPIYKITQDWK